MIPFPPISDEAGPKFPCAMVDETGCVGGVLCCAKVRKTREQYNLCLLDSAPLASHLYDPDEGILACNQEALRLFGVATREAYAQAFATFLPETQPDGRSSATRLAAWHQQALKDGQLVCDCMFRSFSGDPLPMHVRLVRVPLRGKECLAVYMQDMRELRKMEAVLQQRNQELRRGNDLLHTVNAVARILLLGETAAFDETVDSALSLLGRTAAVDRVYIWQNHVGEDNRLYCGQVYEWVHDVEPQQGKPIAENVSYDDTIPNWRVAFEQGECINALVREMSRSERLQLEPQGVISILVHPILLDGEVWGFIGLDDCHRERQWTQAEKSTLKGCGALIAASMEKYLVTTALMHAKERAEQATMAKGDFLARMSHEIRTPMNAILGLAYLCLQTELGAGQRNFVSKIQSSAQNLLGIINDILDFSKIEACKLDIVNEPFAVRQVIEGVLAILEVKAREKGLRFGCRVEGAVPAEVLGDALRVHQVLLNLCGNAVKFTDEGEVEVTVSASARDETGYHLRFAVRDTGPGLSHEEQRRLFQPFSQADESVAHRHGGTGLGLAISRQLVELMGGELGLESVKGEGSVFAFSLPCMPVAAHSSEAEARTAPEPAVEEGPDDAFFHGLRVLLVEDNEINQLIAVSLLEQSGMCVTVANNGREACEMVAAKTFDVVLMDIQMPEMDGLEATARIRSRPETATTPPIIAMTAHAMDRDKEQALETGMNDYISKPFDPPRLMEVLHKWVGAAAPNPARGA